MKRLQYDAFELIPSEGKFKGNNSFCFLNVQHQFSSEIDWNIQRHGKLWNYNLQYFDFIFDEQFSDEDLIPLIENCATSILNHRLPLEPYPVSLRLVNWFLFFSKTGYSSSNFKKALKVQTAYLEKNLEVHLLGNHYFENLVSLMVVALYFNDEILLRKHSKKLNKQLNEQILDDGGHYECSPMYHAILLSRLLLIYRLLQCNNFLEIEIQKPLAKAISKMQGWLQAFCFNNGNYALFNDATNNIAIPTKTIKSIFHKTSLAVTPTNLIESGYRKFSNKNFEVIIDVGNIQPKFQPGHAHSDMLSFCLNFQGEEIFIDPGVSTYEVNEQRLKERGTPFHNTVSINKENQSEVWASFRVAKRAKLSIKTDEVNHCKASHDGYFKKKGVIIVRDFILSENYFEIIDEIVGDSSTEAIAHFYLKTHIISTQKTNCNIKLSDNLRIEFYGCISVQLLSGHVPNGFNNIISSQTIEVVFKKNLKTRIIADN